MQATDRRTDGRAVLDALLDILGALKRREREDPATVFLLRHLREDRPRRVSELAEASRLDVSTVSRHVKSLEEAGLLLRVEDPEDRRAWLLRITPDGASLYDRAMAARGRALEDALERWPDGERRRLAQLMQRLAVDLAGADRGRG